MLNLVFLWTKNDNLTSTSYKTIYLVHRPQSCRHQPPFAQFKTKAILNAALIINKINILFNFVYFIFVSGTINSTARNIEVFRFEQPPPATMREFMNPKVGEKFYDAENMFQREWLTGEKECLLGFFFAVFFLLKVIWSLL